jgi:ADP-ribose pyrophosphatase YjhB (NUDIX family)
MRRIAYCVLTTALLLTACQESLEERCAREAATYTKKNCPMRIDHFTVIDSMTFDAQSHTVSYQYTVSGLLDDTAYINSRAPRELLLKEVRNATNLKLYKEAGYSFRYAYYSAKNKGAKLYETTFREKDYR